MTDSSWRLSVFLLVFMVMACWQTLKPARDAPLKRWQHWQGNFLLLFCSALLARLILPAGLAGVAIMAQNSEWGLFNQITVSSTLVLISSLLLLDMAIYWQHRLMHKVPLLWRLHKVHHADSQVDVTTGLRFHPLEIILSLFYKAIFVLVLGVPVYAVLVFEIGLNAFSVFNHANIRLPKKIDNGLSYLFITQRLHRIHHSQRVSETNSNYGFSVSWWDKLFASFTPTAQKTDQDIKLGLSQYPQAEKTSNLKSMLIMPLDKK